jgi:hypothetical protein
MIWLSFNVTWKHFSRHVYQNQCFHNGNNPKLQVCILIVLLIGRWQLSEKKITVHGVFHEINYIQFLNLVLILSPSLILIWLFSYIWWQWKIAIFVCVLIWAYKILASKCWCPPTLCAQKSLSIHEAVIYKPIWIRDFVDLFQ